MKALVEIQLDALYARDAAGRLTALREPDRAPAPRFALSRSRERNAWAVHAHADEATRRALERLAAAEPTLDVPHADRPPICRHDVLACLGSVESEWRGPAYVLAPDLPVDPRAREVTRADAGLWRDAFPWLAEQFDAVAPVAIAFAAGRAAALCHSPRGCTADAAEAGVVTLEPFRERGLGLAAVACWARAVQRSGRVALYSTSWTNLASQTLARRLSARLYGENWHVR